MQQADAMDAVGSNLYFLGICVRFSQLRYVLESKGNMLFRKKYLGTPFFLMLSYWLGSLFFFGVNNDTFSVNMLKPFIVVDIGIYQHIKKE